MTNPSIPNSTLNSSEIPVSVGAPAKSVSNTPDVPSQGSVEESPVMAPSAEEQLIQRTKLQIRSLVNEISELSKSDCSIEDFYDGFLTRTVSALASVGGAIWIKQNSESPLQLNYQINLKQTGLLDNDEVQKKHGRLLTQLLESGESRLVAPQSGTDKIDEGGNPTEYLLVVGVLDIDQQTKGLVEIFQRPGAGPATQRGYLRFLTQMCQIASDFLRSQELRKFQEHRELWQRLEKFIRQVHTGLDVEQTMYNIANEGRRLLECDRVSVASMQGRRAIVKAVSGLDSIERRAEQIKKLNSLTTRVVRSGEPLWYTGDDNDLPPQLEKKLHEYVDRSHSKMLGIIPLEEKIASDQQDAGLEQAPTNRKPRMLGALIIEQLSDSEPPAGLKSRADVVVEHGQMALSNAAVHSKIFLLPLWQAIGNTTNTLHDGRLTKLVAVVAIVLGILFALTITPYKFSLGAKGQLIPQTQFDVFASSDGVLTDILVSDNADTVVRQGDLLAKMSNSDLTLEIENLDGELQRVRKQKNALLRARNSQRLSRYEIIMLDGEYNEAVANEKSLEEQLKIKREEAQRLNITSPSNGRVVSWQVRQNLLRRPVNRGQKLMTVVDPSTLWELELELPERRVSHLLDALKESDNPLEVSFALASYPGEEFRGKIHSIDQQLSVYSDNGNSILVRVAFENEQVPPELLRSGTRVNAQIECGQRSIGYVYFHELIETVHSSFLLWF